MMYRLAFFFAALIPFTANCQHIEKIVFDYSDSTDGYYLAIRPASGNIKGVIVLLNSFAKPESMLPETKLHNVAYANDLLTIMVSVKQKLYADSITVVRLNNMLKQVVSKYHADASSFVLMGYDFAGTIALRYTELTKQHPALFPVHPKAVIGIDSPVDLFGLWRWCERQIKRNSRSVGDAKYILDLMKREHGSITESKGLYKQLTPFEVAETEPGNETQLKDISVRLYYDAAIEWQLQERQNSLYDTNIPDGSELISRLLQSGNANAALIAAKSPVMNSRGIRTTNSLAIVDEAECIHWIKNQLNIFDPHTWKAPYNLPTLKGWTHERFSIPITFAPQIAYNGVEDVRFSPGWGDEKSAQYWSYAYLWWLDGKQLIDASLIQKHIKAYYEGLVGMNITGRKIPADKVVPTIVVINKQAKVTVEAGNFSGTISMLDYMTQRPMVLHFRATVKDCIPQQHTAVLISVSPKPYPHNIWNDLNRITERFDCGN